MCGRYALGIRATYVRHRLQEQNMPVEEAPEDEETRESYNFAPSYHGLVYRADVPYHGARGSQHEPAEGDREQADQEAAGLEKQQETKYKLQAMKWGLIPFWTKRNPDYGSVMKTINCRDDSLAQSGGMWNSMKKTKRCIIVAQGFYEWLKKNGGKEKIPHYVKRKDGELMLFAGLWDCVQYEGSENKHYTYSIITTDSNKQLKFLHDRMPVILENGSDDIRTWLDPHRCEWSKELQSLLIPFSGELECYPVSKEVGKVGNNSPDFIIPVASKENKNNIANFFASADDKSKDMKRAADSIHQKGEGKDGQDAIKQEADGKDLPDHRVTINEDRSEDNAPMPVPKEATQTGQKRGLDSEEQQANRTTKLAKLSSGDKSAKSPSPVKSSSRKTRSATSNESSAKSSPVKASNGSQRITNFFGK